ncbi:MAG: acetyl-CoA carboxylase biotin carboxylase subunit [Alphaproteobacteria bacterium]|jgi:acetyl-CoA carboxylase biotin carboxylase subunit
MIKKLLIANRGEIAVRIIRACRELGIKTVAVHSTADADSMHVKIADEAVCIGSAQSKYSYLNIPSILTAAQITGVDAIHPGFGFLSENAEFAELVDEHGFIFVGPTSEHIRVMGDKIKAKDTAVKLGIPVVPGSQGEVKTVKDAKSWSKKIGFPLIIKAASGGGGRGMKVANTPEELEEAFNICQTEALSAFGDGAVYMERYLGRPRHIEIQVFGDGTGNALHFFERDCSIQRRHQKVIEEASGPSIDEKTRTDIGNVCVKAMSKMKYRGAGTIEFLYENGEFFFIEMNTRIQVEHPITEMITGFDLIKEQINVASGDGLSAKQQDIKLNGHAIECRINAECPETFMPMPGTVELYHAPGGLGVRVDSHLYAGYSIPPHYDSMIAKLIVHAPTREIAIARMKRALKEYLIIGVKTNIPLHLKLLDEPDFISGDYTIHWLEELMGLK